MSTIFYGICHLFVHNTRKRSPLEMCQLQAPGQLLLFSLTQCARPSSIRASSASPTPKVDELPERGIKGIECWGYLINISIFFGYKNKTRLRLDQLGLSLLRGLHVCFVSFEGLTHAKQGKVADWKHQTPIQPKHEATSRSSCRRCLSSASSACSTCPHLQSQAITDQWWIAPLGHRICLKNPKTMHSLAPKNWFQNDIEIQIRHVSPPVTAEKFWDSPRSFQSSHAKES